MKNSIIVRAYHNYPTHEWIEIVSDLHLNVSSQAQGEVDTVPGTWSGEVDWMFELESDAAWFIMKYGGRIVDPNETLGPLSLMVSLG